MGLLTSAHRLRCIADASVSSESQGGHWSGTSRTGRSRSAGDPSQFSSEKAFYVALVRLGRFFLCVGLSQADATARSNTSWRDGTQAA